MKPVFRDALGPEVLRLRAESARLAAHAAEIRGERHSRESARVAVAAALEDLESIAISVDHAARLDPASARLAARQRRLVERRRVELEEERDLEDRRCRALDLQLERLEMERRAVAARTKCVSNERTRRQSLHRRAVEEWQDEQQADDVRLRMGSNIGSPRR